jgi:hypothetical protein
MSDLDTLIDVERKNRASATAQTYDPVVVEDRAAAQHGYQFSEQKDEAGGGGTVRTVKTPTGTFENRNGVWLTREEPKAPMPEYASTETRVENGVSYLVGIMADGTEYLIGRDGKKEGTAIKIPGTGPQEPSLSGELTRGVLGGIMKGVGSMGEGVNKALGIQQYVDQVSKVLKEAGIDTKIEMPKVSTPAGEVSQEVGKIGAEIATVAIPASSAIKGLASFGEGAATARTLLEQIGKYAGSLNQAQKGAIIGAAVDAFAFGEPQIVSMLNELPEEWRGPITDAVAGALEKARLGKVEDEAAILKDVQNRVRAAAEGAVLSKTIDGAVMVANTLAKSWLAVGMGTAIATLAPQEAEAGFATKAKAAAEAAGLTGPKAVKPLVEKQGPYVKVRAATTEEETKTLAGMDLPVAGLDFNFNRINSTEDVGKMLDAVSTAYKEQTLKKTGGVIRHTETLSAVREKLADDMGIKASDMVAMSHVAPGDMAERITNMRMVLAASAKNTADAANKIRTGNATDADRLEFRRLLALHAALQTNFKGVQTDIARALSAFRIEVGHGDAVDAAKIKNLLAEAGGIETTDKLANAYATIFETNGSRAANIFAQKTFAAKLGDSFFEVYINGLLTGTGTHFSNVLSNAVFDYGILPIERGLASVFGTARRAIGIGGEEQAYLGEAMAMYSGLVTGIKDSLRLSWIALKTETPNDPIGKIEALRHKAITAENFNLSGPVGAAVDWLGHAIRVPGRFLMAEDEFFKAVGYRMELNAQAYRTYRRGLEDGMTKDAALAQAGKVLTDPDATMRATVEDAARYMTFTTPVEGKTLQAFNLLHQTPVGKFVIPFLRTPANVLVAGLERTPFALAFPSIRRDIAEGGARADAALARIALGSLVSIAVGNSVFDGNITGAGPSDPDAREIWLKTHQPYSVKIGDTWVSYQRIDPIAIPIALAANFAEVFSVDVHTSKDEDMLPLLIAGKFADVMKDKAFFAGIGELFQAVTDSKRYGMDYIAKQAGNIAQPVYSSALREVAREIDPLTRNVKPDPNDPLEVRLAMHMINTIRARTPGYTADLAVKPDIFGVDKRVRLDETVENLTGIPIKEAATDKVVEELLNLGMPIAKPEPEIQGVRLSPEYHAEYVKLAGAEFKFEGKTLHDYLETYFVSPAYLGNLPGAKRELVKKIYEVYKDGAKAELIKRHPELRTEAQIEKIRKMVE